MNAPATRRGFAPWLGAIAVTALAARLVHVLALTRGLRGHGDSAYYHELANLLADGRGFVEPSNGNPSALHPPLFPLLLGLPSLLGLDSYAAHRVAVSLVGTGTVVVVGLVGRRVAGERAGLIAAGVAAAYPVLIAADGAVMSETLFGLLTVLCALAAYRLLDRPTVGRAVALGALVGLAALTRGEGLLLLLLLGVPLAMRLPTRRVATLAAAALACLVVLAPWTVRNLSTFEKPVLLSTNEGGLIAGANCARTYSGRDIGGWDINCTFGDPFADESVASASARRRGFDYAREHAGRVPIVVAARLARTFELLQPIRQAEHAEGRAAGIEVAGAIAFLALLPLGAYGALVLRRRAVALAPLLAPFGLAVFATVVGYGVPRFRHPADVALAVLAAVALDALVPAGAGSSVASPRSEGAGGRTSRLSRRAGRSTT
jgi:4-amino-4-deoxy-L-arabinose transferase-like glycosyltransferase